MEGTARPGRSTACGNAGSSLCLVLALALATAAGSLWSPALAQDAPSGGAPRTCDDAFADIYFMPNALDYPDGLPPGMTEGLPKQHLHLPRALLQLRLADLVRIVSDLRGKGVGFESLTGRIETATATGELVFHLFAILAQFERNLIRERTRAGLASARARDRKGGRSPKLGPEELGEIRALLRDPNVTVSSVAKRYGVSRVTLYAHLNAPAKERA